MTFLRPASARHAAPRPSRPRRLAAGAAFAALGLVGTLAIAPVGATEAPDYWTGPQQTLVVSGAVDSTEVVREKYGHTPGIQMLAKHGTNYDWARIVLMSAGFPVTDDSIAVITRWMRQENYIDTWWNRNNPLNNGWGSGGGGGTGRYVSLISAAENWADAILSNPGYAQIRKKFAEGAPSAEIEAAIWASPWSSSHYAGGTHWHYTAVPEVTAPASAWGR